MGRSETLKAALNSQAYHWALFPFVLIVADTSRPSGLVLLGFILTGFFPLLLFVTREFVQSFFLQILFLLVLGGLILLLPIEPGSMKLIFVLFALVYLVISLLTSLRKKDEVRYTTPPFIPLIINLIFSGIGVFYSHFQFSFMMHISTILSIICAILAYYMERYITFTLSNEGIASNMPKKKILQSGLGSNVKYFGIVIAGMVLISCFSVSDAFFWGVNQKIAELWARLVWAVRSLFRGRQEPTDMLSDEAMEISNNLELIHDPQQTSPLARILEVVLFFIVVALIASFVVYVVFAFIKFLLGNPSTKNLLGPEEEDFLLDERENLSEKILSGIPDEDERRLSPSRRIRRLYQKRALASNRAPHDLGRMTAREFANEDGNELMALIYEKARYSTESCTNEDVKRMQQAVRRKA
ncbi:MAG: hypothetical protein J5546_05755 [Lachnospiraceae bacterium]|nr:hypothetical protein [Lachnospiraceae bacterium]